MAFEIPEHFYKLFTSNVELLLQQKRPYFAGAVTMASYSGEAAQVVKQFGTVEFQTRTTRHKDTEFSDLEHKQRWIFPTDYSLALPIDKEDELRLLGSVQSPYADAMRAAWARKWDQVIIDSFFGTAQTGVNGATATLWSSVTATQQVAVAAGASAATGLNVEKLILAREKLAAAEVDLGVEMPHIAVTSKQISDMLRTTEATNADYAALKRLESGEIDTFMGFRFLRSERLGVDASSYRRLPVWVPSAIVAGQWNGLETKIGERPDKEYLTQVFMRGTIGATRTQEKKVVEVLCSES